MLGFVTYWVESHVTKMLVTLSPLEIVFRPRNYNSNQSEFFQHVGFVVSWIGVRLVPSTFFISLVGVYITNFSWTCVFSKVATCT
jgi:hypothetical protein